MLLDLGAKLSSITKTRVKELGLKVQQLHTFLDLEGTGGLEIPYEGYAELNLDIPKVKGFKEDVLMLVVQDSEYGKRVPVAIGTLHIDMILDTATKELGSMGRKWKRGSLGRKISMKQNVITKEDSPFELKKVEGEVKIMKNIVIKPFHTVRLSAKSKVRHHHNNAHVITEDKEGNEQELPNIAIVPYYQTLKQGSDRVPVILKNLTCKPITLQKGKIVAEIGPANAIPDMLAPKRTKGKSDKIGEEEVGDRLEKLFKVLDLKELEKWPKTEQEKAKELIKEYQDIFALKDTELGHTKLIKHEIKLLDNKPFKERYRRIPPQQFEEVCKHLEEMINIGAIRKSQSPWASAILLVRKKDGSLRFCIDLQKLNKRTVKDAYSLPRIEES